MSAYCQLGNLRQIKGDDGTFVHSYSHGILLLLLSTKLQLQQEQTNVQNNFRIVSGLFIILSIILHTYAHHRQIVTLTAMLYVAQYVC